MLAPILGVSALVQRFDALVTFEGLTGAPPDFVRRLAALALGGADTVETLRDVLRLTNAERDRLVGAC